MIIVSPIATITSNKANIAANLSERANSVKMHLLIAVAFLSLSSVVSFTPLQVQKKLRSTVIVRLADNQSYQLLVYLPTGGTGNVLVVLFVLCCSKNIQQSYAEPNLILLTSSSSLSYLLLTIVLLLLPLHSEA